MAARHKTHGAFPDCLNVWRKDLRYPAHFLSLAHAKEVCYPPMQWPKERRLI